MNSATTRFVAALILTCWMSPSVGALGVSLHLALEHHHSALDHHDHRDGEHNQEMLELAQAAHGHHHDAEAAPDHDHDATVDDSAPALKPSVSLIALLPAPTSLTLALAEHSFRDGSPRRGPAVPLFTAHCSLLL